MLNALKAAKLVSSDHSCCLLGHQATTLHMETPTILASINHGTPPRLTMIYIQDLKLELPDVTMLA